MGKFKFNGRVRKVVSGIATWSATSSPGCKVAVVPGLVEFIQTLSQNTLAPLSMRKAANALSFPYYKSLAEEIDIC